MAEPRTLIFRLRGSEQAPVEEQVGYVGDDRVVYRLRWGEGREVGRVDSDGHVLRTTAHGERDLGRALPTGTIESSGVLEGGPIGWMEPDGVVVRGGYIFSEEEVGRVEGPDALPAAAALLLIFVAEEEESDRRAAR